MSEKVKAKAKPKAKPKSVLKDGMDISLASQMIQLGARLQVLEAETDLSSDRLSRLYHEIHHRSPPKGMLPYSTDWFMSFYQNIHATLFYSIYFNLVSHTETQGVQAVIDAYTLYLEHDEVKRAWDEQSNEPVLSFTRAWMLVRFFKSDLMQMSTCSQCNTAFVTHKHELENGFVCVMCKPPARIVGMLNKQATTSYYGKF
ncbi:MAG: flagellar transcriptional regulator FlhC [Advenella sp.]